MRVSEDRYTRDLRRIQLAHRLIRHEVRTYWIRAFTRLTAGRIRNLLRSYGLAADGVRRHRGSPPRLYTRFMIPAKHSEASALAGIALVWHLVPEEQVRNAWRTLPSLDFGEHLCEAFELFRLMVPGATLNLDRFILLGMALAEQQLTVGHCAHCRALILLDPLGAKRRLCVSCERQPSPGAAAPLESEATALPDGAPGTEGGRRRGKQQSLF
ncbi:MAG: hypothetical protein ACYDAE_24850 [Steroidobacteraceae bacterium]